MDNDYDTVTTEFAELYEEYCAESDRLFFEFQNGARYRKNLYRSHVCTSQWYVVPDDLIGGHAVATRNVPVSQLSKEPEGIGAGVTVAEFVSEDIARYIANLHNKARNEVGYIETLYRTLKDGN